MPDIKTAMQAALLRAPAHAVVQKTLNEWDDEGEGKGFPINISSVPSVQTNPVQTNTPMPTTPAKKHGGQITTNVMRATFDFIKNNPGLTNKEIMVRMQKLGYKPGSVSSVVSQLSRTGQLRKDGNTFATIYDEYKPMSGSPTAKINRLKKQVEELRVVAKSKGIKDLPVQKPAQQDKGGIAALAPTPAPTPEAFNPAAFIESLTVYQAKLVYNELKTMFGA